MTWRQIHAVGAGLLLAALLMLSPAIGLRLIENGATTPIWWDLPLVAGVLVCAGGLLVAFARRRDPRGWAGLLAVVTAAGLATFPVVATAAPLDSGEQVWIALLAPVAAAGLGVALRWIPAVCCGIALAAVQTIAHLSDAWPTADHQLVTEAVYLILCAAASATGMEALRSQVRAVDSAEERAIAAAARAGLLAAQQQETARWDAFIHDEVLAALEAARVGHASPDELKTLASGALEAIDRLPGSGRFSVAETRERIAAIAGVPVETRGASTGESLPGDVVEAIESAVAEACRNVRHHTPTGTTMSVTMEAAGDGAVLIEVRDDGAGFDPARVPRTCMGIGVSIVGRMRAVGGDASVRSAHGGPTTVSIRWPAVAR